MKKIAASLILLLLCPLLLFSQGETSNWYFGKNAGIRFNNNGSVTAVNDGELDTFEGCATISDNFGNLLFYTDGISVYDRTHNVMPNGKGLHGDPSSTQSALIVPQPESSTIFYIFTVDTSLDINDADNGFNYSVVDISLNGGLGAVTSKNIKLINNTSEKLTAVIKDCFDKSIWVLTLAPEDGRSQIIDTFYAFEVTSTGVNPRAVKTKLPSTQIQDARGYLKLNAIGDKIAAANVTSGLYIYDFDATTGIVSNEQQITVLDDNIYPYGLEFSPNNRFLYVQTYNNVQAYVGHSSSLLQYDLTAANISESMVLLDKRSIYRGALQLGPDGKIYRALASSYEEGIPFLGVIENPDEPGLAANYRHERIDLNGNNSTQGLPPFIQSFFSKKGLVQNTDGSSSSGVALCEGDSITLQAELLPNATYLWEKDGVPITASGNTYDLNAVGPVDGGRYSLEIIPDDPGLCPINYESLVEILEVPAASIQLTQCDLNLNNSTDGVTTINLDRFNSEDITYYFYENDTDRQNDVFLTNTSAYENTVAFQQTLLYKAVNIKGCEYLGELEIEVFPVSITPSSTGPFYSCDLSADDDILSADFDLNEIRSRYAPLSVDVYNSLEDLSQEQNALSGQYTSEGESVYIRLQDGNQCQGVEIIDLIVNPLPDVGLNDEYLLCTDSFGITIPAPSGFASYAWYQNRLGREELISDLQEITLTETGNYRLEVVTEYTYGSEVILCSNSKSFQVLGSNRAIIETVEIEDFSSNNKVKVSVSGDGVYEYSLDGFNYQPGSIFENLEPGIYTLSVRDVNGCGVTEKEISVLGYPKFFTPNGDGINDFWQITGIEGETAADSRVLIFDRYGRVVTQILPTDIGWNGRASAKDLPAADYWFSITLKNGKEYKGHFALKR